MGANFRIQSEVPRPPQAREQVHFEGIPAVDTILELERVVVVIADCREDIVLDLDSIQCILEQAAKVLGHFDQDTVLLDVAVKDCEDSFRGYIHCEVRVIIPRSDADRNHHSSLALAWAAARILDQNNTGLLEAHKSEDNKVQLDSKKVVDSHSIDSAEAWPQRDLAKSFHNS